MSTKKFKCIFCKRMFANIVKHEDNCPKQFKVLIGPDYEKVRCNICSRDYYKEDKHYWDYYENKLVRRIEFGIWKHLKCAHRIIENIHEYYSSIPIINEEFEEAKDDVIYESARTLLIPDSDYSIDENGVVYNKKGRQLKNHQNETGSFSISIIIGGTQKTKQISHLVALAFIENPNNYQHVIHKDKNRSNNHYTNLEWSDKKEYLKL